MRSAPNSVCRRCCACWRPNGRSPAWCSVRPASSASNCSNCSMATGSAPWPCTAIWNSVNGIRYWPCSPTRAAACWWPPTWPPVAAVINAELSPDPAVHTHRIGRSGRAGQPGLALSLVTPAEQGRARRIEEALGEPLNWASLDRLPEHLDKPLLPPMRTLAVAGGRKDKVRPGDLLGALTGEAGLPGDAIGKISISDFQALVAVRWDLAQIALERLEQGKIKGRRFKVRLL